MTDTGGGANWRTRAKTLSSKVPSQWLVTAVVALFLLGSAAFGGLDTAPPDALPTVAAGTAYTGAELKIAVSRAVLIDGFPEQGIRADEGKRFLVVIATFENVWNRPVTSYKSIGAADNLRPVGVDGITADSSPDHVVVVSDGTESPRLQPHVPIELAVMWQVDAAVGAGLAEVQVDIYDKVYAAGGFVTYGARYDDPFVAASTTVSLKDVGAGADAGTGAGAGADAGTGAGAGADAGTGAGADPRAVAEPTS